MSATATIRHLFAICALATLTACTSLPSGGGDGLPGACELLPRPRVAADSITAAAMGHANTRRLYSTFGYRETLVNVDCEGRVVPGVVASWKREDRGRRWVFRLRDDARRPDGARVTAGVIEGRWNRYGRAGTHIDSVVAVDDNELRVYFARPHDDAPRLLSDVPFTCDVERDLPQYQLLTARRETANDLLEVAVDLMLTADPDVISYAAGRPEFATVALPWNRTYVLLSTTRVAALQQGETAAAVSSDLLEVLARDAVRGDARGAHAPLWWDDLDDCEAISDWMPWLPSEPPGAGAQGLRRVLYDERDPVARGLAERVVALATVDTRSSPEAAALAVAVPGLVDDHREILALGVDRRTLDYSLVHGDDFAYILGLPRNVADPCVEIRGLTKRIRWLALTDEDIAAKIIPLVDTRDHVIARRDRFGLTVDWYSNIRITR